MDQHNQTLDVTVLNPEKIIFDGKAMAISSVNKNGIFDILPFHANFISIIKESVTIYETQEKQQKISLEKGIVKVFENHVIVFLGIETFQQ